jgi:Bacteriophage HK97-gp10, putative tail-component
MPFIWEDLDELKAMLRELPEEFAAEGARIVTAVAYEAKQEIYDAYPVVSGNLRDGLAVEQTSLGALGFQAAVVNNAPHAWMYEHGTQVRYTRTGAFRGQMPPGHVFIPIMERRRRRMYEEEFTELLERAGFTVSLDEAA